MSLTAYFPSPTAGGSPNTKGSYTQVVASSPYASSRLYLNIINGPFGLDNFLLDIATGAGGAETDVVSNLHFFTGNEAMINAYIAIDVDIPAGTRIAVRCQCTTASRALTMGLYLESRAIASIANPVTYGALTVSSLGTQVDPGGTINTKGSYVQFTASSSARIDELIIMVAVNSGSFLAYQQWKLDVATGAAASETVVLPDIFFGGNTFADQVQPQVVKYAISISAGTRIAVRCQCSGNSVGTRELNVVLVGVQVPTSGGGASEVGYAFA